jgi:LPXTG-site transpeptidase (sortase) family protein
MTTTQRAKKELIHNLLILIEGAVIFLVIFLSVMIYANWDAFKSEITYAVKTKTEPTIIATPTATPTPIAEAINEPAHIVIDKINVDAPIQWNIPAESTIDALSHGVAHLDGSAKLGEIGNLFITGHSSDYAWKKNPYAAVFSLLPKLIVGDEISIRENGKIYLYRVTQTKIVNPNQVEVAAPTKTPFITLMTCYPIGSTKQRFIVQAALISSPDKPTAITATPFTVPEFRFR